MKKRIADVKVGDYIMGSDGEWHRVIAKTEAKLPYKMYEVTFSNGVVKCSDTHQWNVFINGKEYTIDTMAIATEFDFYKDRPVGSEDGATIVSIREIPKELVQCITTDTKDGQFLIYAEEQSNE